MKIYGLIALAWLNGSVASAQETATGDPPQTQPAPAREAPSAAPRVETEARRPPNPLRVPESVQLVRDVVYATAPDKNGDPVELKLDAAFLKQSDGKPMPAIIYIHGGGWSMGSKEAGVRPSIALAMGGYFAATIDYRLTDQATYPAAVHDCKAAIRFLRAHAEDLGIDPNRIGVWGHSAGGHLAALMGTTGNSDVLDGTVGESPKTSSAVQCVVDISGPVDLRLDAPNKLVSNWLGGPVRDHQDRAKEASPLTYIDKDDPPVLIVNGTEDPLVNIHRQAEVFEKALKDAGVAVEFLPVKGEGHMITSPKAYTQIAKFFDDHLGGHAEGAVRDLVRSIAGPRPNAQPRTPRQLRRDGTPSEPATTMPE